MNIVDTPLWLKQVMQLEKECFSNCHWNSEQILAHLRNGNAIVFPDCYLFFLENDLEIEILRIGVAATSRRKGRARQILHIVIAYKKNIILEVSANNQAAITLYESFGFIVQNRRKQYYADGSDALLMILQQND